MKRDYNKVIVFFEVYDINEVKAYCTRKGLPIPSVYNVDGTNQYYKTTFNNWCTLYRNLPYNVTGCYEM